MSQQPELNGRRLQKNGEDTIWVVMDGQRRAISDGPYSNLWNDRSGVESRDDLSDIDEGPRMSEYTYLVQAPDEDKTYIVVDDVKRFIPSAEVVEKYQFNKSLARNMSNDELNAIPEGADLS